MRARHKFVRFCFVGFAAFLIDWVVFNISFFLGSPFTLAVTLGWIFAITFNFITNRNWTFSARESPVSQQIVKWVLIYAIAFLVRLWLSTTTLNLLGEGSINANIAFMVGIVVSIPISFLGSLLWAFKKKIH